MGHPVAVDTGSHRLWLPVISIVLSPLVFAFLVARLPLPTEISFRTQIALRSVVHAFAVAATISVLVRERGGFATFMPRRAVEVLMLVAAAGSAMTDLRLAALGSILIAATSEELVYRGVVEKGICSRIRTRRRGRRFAHALLAASISAAIFSLSHGVDGALSAGNHSRMFAAGLVLSAVARRAGLDVAAGAHALYNVVQHT